MVSLDVSCVRIQKWALVSGRSRRRKSSSWADVIIRLQGKLEQANATLEDLPSSTLAEVTTDAAGSKGISAEQILRAIVVQRMTGWGYSDLAFHLQDSSTLRRFCRLGPGHAFSEAMLQEAVQRVSPRTMELVIGHLVAHGF